MCATWCDVLQVQFGIGHPIGSGSAAIDYSVISEDMLDLDGGLALTAAPSIDVRECMRLAFEVNRRSDSRGRNGGRGDNTGGYSSHSGDGSDGSEFDPCRSLPPQCCNTYGAMPLSPPLPPPPTTTTTTTITAADSTTTTAESTTTSTSSGSTIRPLLHYTEQLVLFSSLGHYLDNPLLLYDPDPILDPPPPPLPSETGSGGATTPTDSLADASVFPEFSYATTPFFEPLQFAYNSSCATINAFFDRIHISHTLRAEDLGHCWIEPPSTHPDNNHNNGNNPPPPQYLPHKAHLYGCLQMPKKMHPSFDAVLLGVLINDPTGVPHVCTFSLSKHAPSHLTHALTHSLIYILLNHSTGKVLMMERAADLLSRWQPTDTRGEGTKEQLESQQGGDREGGSESQREHIHNPPSDLPARTLPQSLFPPHLLAQHNISWEQLRDRFIFVPRLRI